MSQTQYYQIGGFQGHLKDIPDALAQKIMGDSQRGVDLVLGITPSGASYLLLSQALYEHRRLPRMRQSWPAARFAALSPIHFATKQELAKKLGALASKKAGRSERPRDRSKANTTYTAAGDVPSEQGRLRAAFEHQRVLVRMCREELPFRLPDYALRPVPDLRGMRVLAFAYNTWAADVRSLRERRADPKVLDVGWTEFVLPDPDHDLRAKSTVHLMMKDLLHFQNPRMHRVNFDGGSSETLDTPAARERLQELFAPRAGQTAPVVLFVHNETRTMDILQAFGVNTSQWASGISGLLYGNGNAQSLGRDAYGARDRYDAARSRSPRRREGSGGRPRSPPVARHAPVHVVDVREMYLKMKDSVSVTDTIAMNAADLKVALPMGIAKDGQLVEPQKSVCAGNESRWLGEMWTTMARGPAIDEQRVLRWQSAPLQMEAAPQAGSSAAVAPPPLDEDDEDFDPNDIVQPVPGGDSTSKGSGRNNDPDAIYSEDDSDESW